MSSPGAPPFSSIGNLAPGNVVSDTDLFIDVQSVGVVGQPVSVTGLQIKTYVGLSPSFTTPNVGVATGTSLALGGAAIGSNALAITGTTALQTTSATALTATSVAATGNVSGAFVQGSAANNLTAAGTNQGTALALTASINNITTAASSTGGALPLASTVGVGGAVVVFNGGANPIKIYGNSGGTDTIDGTAGATGVTLTNAKRCIYYVIASGAYISAQLGVPSG